MNNIDAIKNHLEFLGYSVNKPELKEGDKPFLVATNSTSPTIIIIELEPGITVFDTTFNINKPASGQMDAAINNLSGKCDIVNPFYEVGRDGKITLRFYSVYTGDYVKNVFTRYINLFTKDIEKIYKIPEVHAAFTD